MKKILTTILLLTSLLCLSSCEEEREQLPPEASYDETIWVYYAPGQEYVDSEGKTVLRGTYEVAKVGAFVKGEVLLPLPTEKNIPEGHRFTGYYAIYGCEDYYEAGMQIYDSNCNLLDGSVFLARSPLGNTLCPPKLKAGYEPITYSLEFDAGEGSFANGEKESGLSVVYGNDIQSFPTPASIPEGYYFDGWFTEDGTRLSNGSVPLSATLNGSGYDISDDTINMSAVYTIRTLTVTIDYSDAEEENKSYTVTYGEPLASFDEFYRDTGIKETVGWSLFNQPDTPLPEVVKDDLHICAVWRDYKIVDFILPDGDAYTEKFYDDGATPITLPWFDVAGYRLLSWHGASAPTGNSVTSVLFDDMEETYNGRWQLTDYALSFEVVHGQSFPEVRYFYGDTPPLHIPTVPVGHTFSGWYIDNPDEAFYSVPETLWGDYTLKANITPSVYTVHLDANGGRLIEEFTTVTYGEYFSTVIPTLSGYRFLGWYDQKTGGNQITDHFGISFSEWLRDENGITLYAHWEKTDTE